MERNETTAMFWKKNKHKYEHLDIKYADIIQICKAPFIQMSLNIKNKTMKDIRLPYLGRFSLKTRMMCWQMVWAYNAKDNSDDDMIHYIRYKDLFEKRLDMAWSEYKKHRKLFEHIIDVTPYENKKYSWDSSK